MNLTKRVKQIESGEHYYIARSLSGVIGLGNTLPLAVADNLHRSNSSSLHLQIWIKAGNQLWVNRSNIKNMLKEAVLISYVSNTVTRKSMAD